MKKVVKLLTILSVIALPQLLFAHIFKVTNNRNHSVVVMIDSYSLSKETAGLINELPITFTVPQGEEYSHRVVSLIQPDGSIPLFCIRKIKVTNPSFRIESATSLQLHQNLILDPNFQQRHPLIDWPIPWCSRNWQWEITITEDGAIVVKRVVGYSFKHG